MPTWNLATHETPEPAPAEHAVHRDPPPVGQLDPPTMNEPSPPTATPLTNRQLRRADQDRTLAAMHDLEATLATPEPGREASWRTAVLAALIALDEATDQECTNAASPDSLLSDIKRTQPRLRTQVRGLRTQYSHLRQTITSVRVELARPDDDGNDYADIRQRLAWLLTALRHQRARESDLIYQAYYDAFETDLSLDRRNHRQPGE